MAGVVGRRKRVAAARNRAPLGTNELLIAATHCPGVASTRQAAAQLRALRWAQNSVCAGCGTHVPSAKRLKQHDPAYPTFDHVVPKSSGGQRRLSNGLLKHQRCNQARGNQRPTGCDVLWLAFTTARLSSRPKSFRPFLKGGIPNPDFAGRRA
jgi:5-methylcytosine-specific restriction endonuclease McrA